MPANKKAVFAGCARGCSNVIQDVLQNISRMAELFEQSAFVFAENDSKDDTKLQLQRWCQNRQNSRVLSLDGLATAVPIRTIRIATARNHLISLIRRDFHSFDFLFVLDCDDVNAGNIDVVRVKNALDFLQEDSGCAGVFANQVGTYYDLWALRHPVLCPSDIWEDVCDYAASHWVPDKQAFENTFLKRVFALPTSAPPLEVDSAFGGLGIYKVESVLKNAKDYIGYKKKIISPRMANWLGTGAGEFGWQVCDHISFNSGFRESGQTLYVLPYLTNRGAPSGTPTSFASVWRTMLFDLRLVPSVAFDPENPHSWGTVARNQTCPCGSGKRYKHCHGVIA